MGVQQITIFVIVVLLTFVISVPVTEHVRDWVDDDGKYSLKESTTVFGLPDTYEMFRTFMNNGAGWLTIWATLAGGGCVFWYKVEAWYEKHRA